MHRAPLRLALVLITASVLVAGGCSSGGRDGVRGDVREDGSSTLYPIAEAVAEEFRAAYPAVRVSVGVSGTGRGIRRLCSDEIDLANASRAMTPDEAAACRSRGVEVIELAIARDGITVVANPSATWLECLTVDELARLWRPGSEVVAWRDLRPAFPDEEVHLFGAGASSGTFDFFTEKIVGTSGASRPDYQASEDDNVIVTGVAGDVWALGFFGYAYFAANADRLRGVAIDAGAGCVAPSPATIHDGSYRPLVRTLYLYVNVTALDRPAVSTYLDFLLSHAERLVAEAGYDPLSAEEYIRARTRVADAVG